ncbi:L-fuculose-phosphate aldolase [Mesorhizobium sp. J18]|uniref:class II aldolase/adducin family protein n=1 Tax=Mesorhizobium sp. J18 TaxID=935263 RepID=UPI001199B22F|nr:class II aldolase/adducin family protein [Mesorhizobium sp. J18]TWG91784.1 L-fuculose-phosphate aldolase [Mesorhizobium sp. J18]
MSSKDLRAVLIDACLQADRLGLNSGTAGNLSVRYADRMLITPTGIACCDLKQNMIVECALDGGHSGRWRPSSEWNMHAEIYKAFPEAQAVVHAHPDNCVALSCLRKPLPAFHYMIASFGGDDVPCSAYACFGSRELAQAAVQALQGRNACLLANHGMICFSDSADKAVANAAKLETLARQYLKAHTIASPVLLDEAEMRTVRSQYRTYGQQPAADISGNDS